VESEVLDDEAEDSEPDEVVEVVVDSADLVESFDELEAELDVDRESVL
jgi:hypothetical protein